MRMRVHVDTNGLAEKLSAFSDVEAKRAIRAGVARAARKGRDLARAQAPVAKRPGTGNAATHLPGSGRAAIRSQSVRGLSNTALARVYIRGGRKGPAFYMYWQDEGTGRRHNRHGANRGSVEPQRFMERAGDELQDKWVEFLMEVEIDKALAKAGLV